MEGHGGGKCPPPELLEAKKPGLPRLQVSDEAAVLVSPRGGRLLLDSLTGRLSVLSLSESPGLHFHTVLANLVGLPMGVNMG